MKLLIAYDGSKCSEAAIDDLTRAGLPRDGEALVVSIAEVWLPPPNGKADTGINLNEKNEVLMHRQTQEDKRLVAEAQSFANHVRNRIKRMFPSWLVSSEATYGSPAFEILSLADNLRSDLIVVGSHGRSAIGRIYFGSVSQRVLTEAKCSVRVARGRIEVEPGPSRIMIGFDGTAGAITAVESVLGRDWPEGSEVRLFSALEPVFPTTIGRFLPPVNLAVQDINEHELVWIKEKAAESMGRLTSAGLNPSLQIKAGNPRYLLIEEAEHWGADSIFVGANSAGGRFERFLIGSNSAAIAARAHCSVEVVREVSSLIAVTQQLTGGPNIYGHRNADSCL